MRRYAVSFLIALAIYAGLAFLIFFKSPKPPQPPQQNRSVRILDLKSAKGRAHTPQTQAQTQTPSTQATKSADPTRKRQSAPAKSAKTPKPISQNELNDFFQKTTAKTAPNPTNLAQIYKNTYNLLSKDEKTFLKENLSKIGLITQRYLDKNGYPHLAAQLGISGANIVEFFLHPNGDISEITLISSSGTTMLDENTKSTIKEAYKDYPLPSQTTRIRILVNYIIIR